MPKRITPEDIRAHLPRTGLVWLHGCSGWSATVNDALAGADLSALTLTGIFVPGINRLDGLLAAGARVASFFMLPELAKAPAQVDFLPLSYREIAYRNLHTTPLAAVFMVAPPDSTGECSFGPVNDFLADIWERIPIRIAQINPLMPRTAGRSIPVAALSAMFEMPESLPESDPGTDAVAQAIAAQALPFIPNGATIQAGLGRVPEGVLRGLTGHRDLAIHSGLIGDSALHLLGAGALRSEAPITAGVAIGTRALYDALDDPAFRFAPPSVTHELTVLARLAPLVTINSALAVDLDGQAFAEATRRGPVSGPGGASDFISGARGAGGLRMVVLPAAAGNQSRIVSPGGGFGPVSLGRFDTDVVITEYGAADLRGLGPEARQAAMRSIAAPEHCSGL